MVGLGGGGPCTSMGIDTGCHGLQWSGWGGGPCTSMGINTGCHGLQWSGWEGGRVHLWN